MSTGRQRGHSERSERVPAPAGDAVHHLLIPLSLRSLGMTALIALQLAAQERFEFKELHMGMEVRIVLYAAGESRARSEARIAFDRIEEAENIMSDYRANSELRRLERRAGEWVEVSGPLFGVLSMAVEVAELTKGAFDPTVAPLVHIWREARRTGRMPARSALDSARALVGWKRIELAKQGNRVRLAPGTRLDLGGIAKGYIIDLAASTLFHRDVVAMVEAGGDISVGIAPPGRAGWAIDLGDTTVVVDSTSISMSGPTSQFVEIGGVRYSHVVDPRTGLGLTNGYTVTVIYPVGAIADALATGLSVQGLQGLPAVQKYYPGVTARFRRN